MSNRLPSRMGALLPSWLAVCASLWVPWLTELGVSPVGNLCRCTGYRPIVDACKTFCNVSRKELISKCIFSQWNRTVGVVRCDWGKSHLYWFRATFYLKACVCYLILGTVLTLIHWPGPATHVMSTKHFDVGCGHCCWPVCLSHIPRHGAPAAPCACPCHSIGHMMG